MDDDLTPEQRFAAEDPEKTVPRDLMKGRDPDEIIADLVRLDWTPEAARSLFVRVGEDLRRFHSSPEGRAGLLAEARRQFVAGTLLVAMGVVVTAFTFFAALAGGLPFFVVAIGLIGGGGVLAGRGWSRWRFFRGAVAPPELVDPPPARNE
jgi:hypothetical protein